MVNTTDIIHSDRAIAKSNEDATKDVESSSEDETVQYASSVSNLSNSQESNEDNSDVDDLSEQFNSTLTVEDKTDCPVESLTEKLKEQLKVAEEKDFQARQPERIPHYSNRLSPYQQPIISPNHFSGGSFSQENAQPGNLNVNYQQLNIFNDENHQEHVPQLIALSAEEVSEVFNNLPGPESNNIPIPVSNESFTIRQSTPSHSLSPGSSPRYWNADVFSPQSTDTDASQPVSSPQPSTSRSSLTSSSPFELLPRTLPNTSDEEEERIQEGTTELRNLIDNELKEIKKYEWISANTKDVETLIRELRKLLCKDNRMSDRRLVRIYAIISSILNQNGPLKQFFLNEPNILSFIALKNHRLLLKYIIETMQSLGINPEHIGENPARVLINVIEQNQNMSEVLKVLLTFKTKTGAKMFDVNEIDQDGLTAIHRVLLKIRHMEDPEIKNLAIGYLKICLEQNPDFTMTTSVDCLTYLHYAIVLGCGPQVVEMILGHCASQNPGFDLVNKKDANGNCALRMAEHLTENRFEVVEILLQYHATDIYQNLTDELFLDLLNHII